MVISSNDDGLLKSIADSKGVALERAADVETVVVAFMTLMNQYMGEVNIGIEVHAGFHPLSGEGNGGHYAD